MSTIRLPDPLTQPGAPGFVSARLLDNDPTYRERLPGGRVISIGSSAQYWGVVLNYEELLPDEYDIILSTILSSKNSGDAIEVLLPHKENYRVTGNTSTVIVTAGQKGGVLNITNFSSSVGLPKLGDLLKLTNHCSKVYAITSVQLVGTTLTLGVYPNLFKETTGNEKPIFNNILFRLVLENPDKWDYTFTSEGTYSSFQIELSEDIVYD